MPHVNSDGSVSGCTRPDDKDRFHITKVYIEKRLAGLTQQKACEEMGGIHPATINRYLEMFDVEFYLTDSIEPRAYLEYRVRVRINADRPEKLQMVRTFLPC